MFICQPQHSGQILIFLLTVRKSSVFLHQSKLSQKRNNRLKFFYIWRCDSLVFYIPCQPSMFVYNCTSFSSPALHFNRQLSPTDRREYARMNAKELVAYSNKEQKAEAFAASAATTEFMPPFTVQCPLKWLVTMQ